MSAAARKAPAGPQCPVSGSRAVGLAKVLDGESFVASDGSEIRLAGVLAPGAGGEAVSRAAAESTRQALARLLSTGALSLAMLDGATDRNKRVVAQVFADGAWVQGNLLKAGAVRMTPDRASLACAAQLLAAEDEASAARAGHWGDGVFLLHTPDEIRGRVGSSRPSKAQSPQPPPLRGALTSISARTTGAISR
jgi:endonuclease YncB( thermonuclease family)